jgi:hypothetical protein
MSVLTALGHPMLTVAEPLIASRALLERTDHHVREKETSERAQQDVVTCSVGSSNALCRLGVPSLF